MAEFIEKLKRFARGLSLHDIRHHGRRRFRDGAAVSFKADVLDFVAVELDIDGDLVAAQGIIPFGFARRVRHRMIIMRVAAVVEDYFLIEVAKFRHGNKISRSVGSSTWSIISLAKAYTKRRLASAVEIPRERI